MTTSESDGRLSAEYLAEAERDARRFSGAYTGTSGTLAAHVMRLLKEVRQMTQTMEEINQPLRDAVASRLAQTTIAEEPDTIPVDWILRGERELRAAQPVTPAAAVKERVGERVKFDTGAVRSGDAEETRYDLVSPIGLEAVARTCAEGAAKYGDWNWEKGMPVHDLLNHAIRHIYRYLAGDRSEPHLPHAAWGLLAAIHSDELWPHLNEHTLRGPGCKTPEGDKPAATGPAD